MVSIFLDLVFLEMGTKNDRAVGAMLREASGVQEEIWEEVMSWLSQPHMWWRKGWDIITYGGPEVRGPGVFG